LYESVRKERNGLACGSKRGFDVEESAVWELTFEDISGGDGGSAIGSAAAQ
jgi:hypothetical protein